MVKNIFEAIWTHDLEAIRKIKDSRDNINYTNNAGYTPLGVAFSTKNIEVIKAILEFENIDVNALIRCKDPESQLSYIGTPLVFAVSLDNSELLRTLLAKKADPNLILPECDNLNPLMCAIKNDKQRSINTLLPVTDGDSKDIYGRTIYDLLRLAARVRQEGYYRNVYEYEKAHSRATFAPFVQPTQPRQEPHFQTAPTPARYSTPPPVQPSLAQPIPNPYPERRPYPERLHWKTPASQQPLTQTTYTRGTKDQNLSVSSHITPARYSTPPPVQPSLAQPIPNPERQHRKAPTSSQQPLTRTTHTQGPKGQSLSVSSHITKKKKEEALNSLYKRIEALEKTVRSQEQIIAKLNKDLDKLTKQQINHNEKSDDQPRIERKTAHKTQQPRHQFFEKRPSKADIPYILNETETSSSHNP